jgi:hypothetical protein
MTARKKPLTIHDFPEVDLGDNHFIHAKNLYVHYATDNCYRVYILHIKKYCYDVNKNPRFVLIDADNINKMIDTDRSINISRTICKKTLKLYFYPTVTIDRITTQLTRILFGVLPKDKVFIYRTSTLDVRKKSISIGSRSDTVAEVHSSLIRVDLSESIGIQKIVTPNGEYRIKALITYNKKKYTKVFIIHIHGEENARKLAYEWRNAKRKELEEKFPLMSLT